MRLHLPILLFQLGPLVLGERMESGISEIDLLIPKPDSPYELADDHRFPIVWAVRNASLWTGRTQLWYSLVNLTQPDSSSGNGSSGKLEYSDELNIAGDESDTRYLSADVLLAQTGDFELHWTVQGDLCEKDHPGNTVKFSTLHGGRKIDLPSVVDASCFDRSAMAFNIANASDHPNPKCNEFLLDQDGPPTPQPCDFKVDNAALPNITKALDDQFNKTCAGAKPQSSLCPQTMQTKKSSAVQLGIYIWLLSLPVMAIFW